MITALSVEELPTIKDFGMAFYAETQMPGGFHPEKFVALWTHLMMMGLGAILVARNAQGVIVGGLGCMTAPDVYDGDATALECFIYVLPEKRGGMTFFRLLRAYEDWAAQQGVAPDNIRVACMEGYRPDDLEAAYRKLGYVPLERHFQKRSLAHA